MRVVVSEFIDMVGLELLRGEATVEYDPSLYQYPERLAALLADADGLVVRNQTRVTSDLIALAPKLRVIGRLGTGLDNVDVAAAGARGIPVVYAPGANAQAVAEYVLGCLLALSRQLVAARADMLAGDFDRTKFTGHSLRGKLLGIAGTGATGLAAARLALAMGMHVRFFGRHDPRIKDCEFVADKAVFFTGLEAISLHLPLTAETRGFLGRDELQSLAPGSYVINAARGELIDEDAVYEAVASGQVAGAALDVFKREPPQNLERWGLFPQVILTPHVAGLTVESQHHVSRIVAGDVVAILRGDRPRFPARLV
jgi:phosphoglycerate dehydrogenase-like enzyme